MEDRLLVAAAVALATLLGFGWVAYRKFEQRQQFRLRQQGRNKSVEWRQDRLGS